MLLNEEEGSVSLDDNFFKRVGLDNLPESVKSYLRASIYEELEERLDKKMKEGMDESTILEMDMFNNEEKEGIEKWLNEHFPLDDPHNKETIETYYEKYLKDHPEPAENSLFDFQRDFATQQWLCLNRPDYLDIARAVMQGIEEEIKDDPQDALDYFIGNKVEGIMMGQMVVDSINEVLDADETPYRLTFDEEKFSLVFDVSGIPVSIDIKNDESFERVIFDAMTPFLIINDNHEGLSRAIDAINAAIPIGEFVLPSNECCFSLPRYFSCLDLQEGKLDLSELKRVLNFTIEAAGHLQEKIYAFNREFIDFKQLLTEAKKISEPYMLKAQQ